MGEFCNGVTHSGSDDSYSQWSYDCPGPDKCHNAKQRLKKKEEAMKPEFYVRHEVVMIEKIPSRDDGFEDREQTTVLASNKVKLNPNQIASEIAKVTR